ncbi:MAG TPA: hypothetical protein VN715_12440 [Roseiarcus sp.]|nr:hypothetical protein [Roseiarcus sp.]
MKRSVFNINYVVAGVFSTVCCLIILSPHGALSESPCYTPEVNFTKIILDLLRSKSNKIILDNDKYLSIHDEERGSVWTFTKAGHPANPAYVCRYPVQAADGTWHTQIEAKCGGPKDQCDALIQNFKHMR